MKLNLNKSIRKISEEDNPFFDLMQYKVTLEFISEIKNRQLYNKYKKIILSEFRSISIEINKSLTTFYLKYKLISNKAEENLDKIYSLNLTEESNIHLKFLILEENEDKQKYITEYLNSMAQNKNQILVPYSRLFILNDKFY